MGYDYCFYISVDDPEALELKTEQVLKEYEELLRDDGLNFPRFGIKGHTGSGGYGCGITDDTSLINLLVKFTQKFPEHTFKIWYTYFDNTCLKVYEIKNYDLLSTFEVESKYIELIKGFRVLMQFYENFEIDNDITEWFYNLSEKYD